MAPRDFLSDYPARKWVLAGAAPSLESNYAQIVELQSSGWGLAVCDMALLPFVHRGIYPDILFTCEARAYPFFSFTHKNLPDFSQMAVAAPTSAHPAQLSLLQSMGVRRFMFFQWQEESEKISHVPVVPSGGNVLNAMLVFLGGLKGAKLHLFGNDYSFTNKGFYPRGSAQTLSTLVATNRWSNQETKLHHVLNSSKRLAGGVYTTEAFVAYRQWQEKYLTLLNDSGHVYVIQ